jgi:hypothetical protein
MAVDAGRDRTRTWLYKAVLLNSSLSFLFSICYDYNDQSYARARPWRGLDRDRGRTGQGGEDK